MGDFRLINPNCMGRRFRDQKKIIEFSVKYEADIHSFAGFWYPATKICISLVYIIGTNIETKEKRCRTSIYRTESRQFHWRACSFVI